MLAVPGLGFQVVFVVVVVVLSPSVVCMLGSSGGSEFSASSHSECPAPDWKDEVQ